jgi:hypothetical protein
MIYEGRSLEVRRSLGDRLSWWLCSLQSETGVVSPLTAHALAARDVKVTTKALHGPLQ